MSPVCAARGPGPVRTCAGLNWTWLSAQASQGASLSGGTSRNGACAAGEGAQAHADPIVVPTQSSEGPQAHWRGNKHPERLHLRGRKLSCSRVIPTDSK